MNTEEKLTMENDTARMKREYKYASENLLTIKADTNEIIATKERISREVVEKQAELLRVMDTNSAEKLTWASKQHDEMVIVERMKSDAENVLKRKAELNQQEEGIGKLIAEETEIRNEARRLELKNQQDIDIINAEKKIIADEHKKIEQRLVEIENDRKLFKDQVEKVLKTVEKL